MTKNDLTSVWDMCFDPCWVNPSGDPVSNRCHMECHFRDEMADDGTARMHKLKHWDALNYSPRSVDIRIGTSQKKRRFLRRSIEILEKAASMP